MMKARSLARALHTTARTSNVKVSRALALGSTPVADMRPGISPIYTGPSYSAISVLKRTCLGFGIIGLYLAELIYSSPTLSSELGVVLASLAVTPLPLVHYFTQDYVSRIFRLYEKNSTQDLDTLTKNETLLAEKISLTGRSYYNTLIKVDDLKVTSKRAGWVNWETNDASFYVQDDVGGMRMDRIWGIAEAHIGLNNGRCFDQ